MQRATPFSLRDLGNRLGMGPRFDDLAEREADEDWPAVSGGLARILSEIDQAPHSRLHVADLLEVIGGFCTKPAIQTEDALGDLTTRACWERCLTIRAEILGPAHSETIFARYLLGSWLANSGDHERLLRMLRENLEHVPGPDPSGLLVMQHGWTARAMRAAGRMEEALDCWNRALELVEHCDHNRDSNQARARASRAAVFAEMGRIPEAMRDCEAALTHMEFGLPDTVQDLMGIAHAYASILGQAGDLEGAELAHQLHVVVGVRHAIIPLGRTYPRPPMSPDLEIKIKALWDRFPPKSSSEVVQTRRGWIRRAIDRFRGQRSQSPIP